MGSSGAALLCPCVTQRCGRRRSSAELHGTAQLCCPMFGSRYPKALRRTGSSAAGRCAEPCCRPAGSSLLTGPEGLMAKERENLKRLKCLRRYRQRYGVEALLHRQLKERRVMATDGAAQQVCGAARGARGPALRLWGSASCSQSAQCRGGGHQPALLAALCCASREPLASWPPGRLAGWRSTVGQPKHCWPSWPPGRTVGSWSPAYWSPIGQPGHLWPSWP